MTDTQKRTRTQIIDKWSPKSLSTLAENHIRKGYPYEQAILVIQSNRGSQYKKQQNLVMQEKHENYPSVCLSADGSWLRHPNVKSNLSVSRDTK